MRTRGGGGRTWAGGVAALADALGEGWRAGATALWAAGRRREAVWLRADYQAAAAVIRGAASGRREDVDAAIRRCRGMADRSAAHALLAAPWGEAARLLTVATAGTSGSPRAAGRPRPSPAPRGGAPLAARVAR